jgi:hypothetical protein
MGSFRRSLFGYRRAEVDVAIASRESRISGLEREVAGIAGEMERMAAKAAIELKRNAAKAAAQMEQELSALSNMVLEREREIRNLSGRLLEANERHDRSIASLDAVSARLEEIQAQARGQATRIRMKALREAVEVGRKAQEFSGDADEHADAEEAEVSAAQAEGLAAVEEAPVPANGDGNGQVADFGPRLFDGLVMVEIGPLGDFSQLVGFQDAACQIDATAEISVERFSEGRATLSMRLDEPIELLRELEERSPLGFRVRHTSGDDLILDVDEEQGPEQQAA